MNVEEAIRVIKEELLKQAAQHKDSAVVRLKNYAHKKTSNSLWDCIRYEMIGEALLNFSRALSVAKVEKWKRGQKETSG